ncbi:MAG: beta-lactamase family protein [Bacteroidales bacterium]|nr:beta-lactamase family protein [Bacteroidales bacterium]
MKKQFLFFVIVSFISISLNAQHKSPPFITDSLENYINRALKQWNIPGVAIAVVKDGKVILSKGYGIKSINKQEKPDENTIFLIGSNTKAFTGTLMAWLAYDNKCTMNDKVIQWLPGFTMKDPWVTKELNLTDILSHRMGLETFQGDFMYWTSDLKPDGVIQKFGLLTPAYDFRTKWDIPMQDFYWQENVSGK